MAIFDQKMIEVAIAKVINMILPPTSKNGHQHHCSWTGMIYDIPNVRFTYKWGHETQRTEESKIDDENSQNFFASKCLHIFCT